MSSVSSSSKNCPSAECVSADSFVRKEADVFEKKTVSRNHILQFELLNY
jgi:hypothetical protein